MWIATIDAESLTAHKEDDEDVLKLDDPLFVKFKASHHHLTAVSSQFDQM